MRQTTISAISTDTIVMPMITLTIIRSLAIISLLAMCAPRVPRSIAIWSSISHYWSHRKTDCHKSSNRCIANIHIIAIWSSISHYWSHRKTDCHKSSNRCIANIHIHDKNLLRILKKLNTHYEYPIK